MTTESQDLGLMSHPKDNLQPMTEQDTMQREAREDLFFFKAIYKQRAYIFGIRIYRSGRLH